jgi:hypothetical protein
MNQVVSSIEILVNSIDSSIEYDKAVQNAFGLNIQKRMPQPHETLQSLVNNDKLHDVIKTLLNSLHVHGIELSYAQYTVLLEIYTPELERIRSGSQHTRLQVFIHPTLAFILQISDLLHQNENITFPEVDIELAERSLACAMNALNALQQSRAITQDSGYEQGQTNFKQSKYTIRHDECV